MINYLLHFFVSFLVGICGGERGDLWLDKGDLAELLTFSTEIGDKETPLKFRDISIWVTLGPWPFNGDVARMPFKGEEGPSPMTTSRMEEDACFPKSENLTNSVGIKREGPSGLISHSSTKNTHA